MWLNPRRSARALCTQEALARKALELRASQGWGKVARGNTCPCRLQRIIAKGIVWRAWPLDALLRLNALKKILLSRTINDCILDPCALAGLDVLAQ